MINSQNFLPTDVVYDIAQDSMGYIWIAHNRGLSRFDGREMVLMSSKNQQGKGRNNILFIRNQVWCQDFSGNFYYVNQSELVEDKTFKIDFFNPALALNNSCVVSENKSIKIYDIAKQKIQSIPTETGTWQNKLLTEKGIYFVSNNTLFLFDGKKVSSIQQLNISLPNFSHLLQIGPSFYGFTKNKTPYIYNISENKAINTNVLPEHIIIQQVQLLGDEIWISTSEGAYCFDKQFKPNYKGRCFFENHSILKVLVDHEGSYWFSTQNNGIIYVPNIYTRLFPFEDESITAIDKYKDDSHLLVGTSQNTVLSFDCRQEIFEKIYQKDYVHAIHSVLYDSSNASILLSSDKIYAVKNGKTINQIDVTGRSISKVGDKLYLVALNPGFGLVPVTPNDTLVPDWLKSANQSWENGIYPIKKGITRGRCSAYNPSTQTLYFSTAQGLFFYNKNTKGEITFNQVPIICTQMSVYGDYIIASTFSQGIFKIKNEEIEWLNLKKPSLGLSYFKLKISKDDVWLLNEEKLIKYNIKTNVLLQYNALDGLATPEVKEIYPYDENLYLASSSGLIELNDEKVTHAVAPRLLLNEISINHEMVDLHKKDEFSHIQNDVNIHFSLLTFRANSQTTVKYRINGKEWQNVDKYSSHISLPALSPDDYHIEIFATRTDGSDAQNKLDIHFTIAAPFYKTWWFLGIIVLSTLALSYLFFRVRNKGRRTKNLAA